jgi:hypothetical protein
VILVPAALLAAATVSAAAPGPPDPAAVAEALAAGDAHYARRAEGAHGETVLPFHADGALVEYRRALALDPDALDADTSRRKGSVPDGPAVAAVPAAEAYLWAAVSWGQWAVYHRLSGAWRGSRGRTTTRRSCTSSPRRC